MVSTVNAKMYTLLNNITPGTNSDTNKHAISYIDINYH